MEKKNQNEIKANGGRVTESSLKEIEVLKNVSLDAIASISREDIGMVRRFSNPPAMCKLVLKLNIAIFFPNEV